MKVDKKVRRKAAKNRLAWTCAARIRFLDAEFRRRILSVVVLALLVVLMVVLPPLLLGLLVTIEVSSSFSSSALPSSISLLGVVERGGREKLVGVAGAELVLELLVILLLLISHRRVDLVGVEGRMPRPNRY